MTAAAATSTGAELDLPRGRAHGPDLVRLPDPRPGLYAFATPDPDSRALTRSFDLFGFVGRRRGRRPALGIARRGDRPACNVAAPESDRGGGPAPGAGRDQARARSVPSGRRRPPHVRVVGPLTHGSCWDTQRSWPRSCCGRRRAPINCKAARIVALVRLGSALTRGWTGCGDGGRAGPRRRRGWRRWRAACRT